MRIEIDLNSRDAEGRVPAFLSDADGHVSVGDLVTAFESEDEVAAPAVVKKIAHGVAYLDVDWDAMTDDIPVPIAKPATVRYAHRSSTSSGASWVPITIKKMVTPLLATAAAVAAATGAGVATTASGTAAPNSVSMRDVTTAMEAGDTA
ncbi:hypothetical protein ACF09J_07740 [Streptomyces sp. NPDC014889]|uniref:hypothetical protein n=1 Tax=Streptomyces sp. NPDC014889 TaxID=3364928 RepID=UPI0037036088